MPTITRLEYQKNDPERVNIYLDGGFAFGASGLVVLSRGLTAGMTLTEAEIEDLRHDEEAEKAFGAALNFLSYRPRSRRELEMYFRRRKLAPELAEAVIQRLIRTKLLDDQEFARFWVDNRQSFQPRGTRMLRGELRQKGLSTEVIDEVLENLGDEEEAAVKAGRRKAHTWRELDQGEYCRRMIGFLQRRGFPYSVALAATRRLGAEIDLAIDVDPDATEGE